MSKAKINVFKDVQPNDIYKQLYELNHYAICLLEASTNKIVETNLAFESIFGVNKNLLLQSKFSNIIVKEDVNIFENKLETFSIDEKDSFTCIIRFSKYQKEQFWGKLHYSILKENNQKFALVSVIDVSELKNSETQLIKSENQYRQLFDHSLNTIGIYDIRSHCYIDCNQVFTEVYGYDRNELHNVSALDLTWDVDGDEEVYRLRYEENLKKLYNDETIRFESNHRGKKGNKIAVDVVLIPYYREGKLYIKQVTTDITERIKAREGLKKNMEELKLMNKELENFAYVTSHDLKEPLRSIVSFSQLLKRNLESDDIETNKEYLDYVINAGIKLSGLITDILEFSKVNYQSIKFEPIYPVKLIDDILVDLSKITEDVEVVFEIGEELPTQILGNPSYIYQLFQNLIKNAVKFRHPDRQSYINVSYRNHPQHHEFIIGDNGIGIDKESFQEIFTIFNKSKRKTNHEGSGLGLAICKKVVELHMGEIWLESEIDKGSSFHFTLNKRLEIQ